MVNSQGNLFVEVMKGHAYKMLKIR
jgi:hypothetical protein